MHCCEDFEALLDLYADGELSPEDMVRVGRHLAGCPACRRYVGDVFAVRAAFPDVEDTEVPQGFAENVMERVRAQTPSRTAGRRRWWGGMAAALAACFAIVVLMRTVPLEYGAGADSAAYDEGIREAAACPEEESGAAGSNSSGEDDPALYYTSKEGDSASLPAGTQSRAAPTYADDSAAQTGGGLPECADDLAEAPETVQPYAAPTEKENAAAAPEPAMMAPAVGKNEAEFEEIVLEMDREEADLFMKDFAPIEESGTSRVYLLTREECVELLELLPISDGSIPEGDLIRIIVTAE